MLEARDYRGRIARTAVTLVIRRPKPIFVRLAISTGGRRAKVLRLRVASSVPARFRLTGRGATPTTAQVSLKPRRVLVPVRPGRGTLKLRARLTAHGKATTVALRVPR